ncbi:hypothetical protein VHEMI05878 [[Torrubiella] hemipterigena]|uniref:Uncharacterized protein n=1 Tax=[Torrubiella] hemipterigena TaxID=1531966 RepID=A0A0A1THR2_9HYPO|nr:hypothetical protein VHEMI05878 [[Torrubiella] hemipterigena]
MRFQTLGLAALAAVVDANTNHPVSFMTGDPLQPALWAAPQWNLPTGTCLPSEAKVNGAQNPGNAQDNCNIHKLNHNCPSQPNWTGADTPLWSFPTYYDHKRCSTTEFRTAYNVYFTKDTGHRHDIEWVIVVWGSNDNGQTFYRNRMIFEQDGHHPSKQWGDIQNTFDNQSDQLKLGQKYQNHARVFVSKWHHSMHDDRYTQFKNTCPPNSVSDFRTNDYYFWSNQNLQHIDTIPADWNYSPAAWVRGQGICNI